MGEVGLELSAFFIKSPPQIREQQENNLVKFNDDGVGALPHIWKTICYITEAFDFPSKQAEMLPIVKPVPNG